MRPYDDLELLTEAAREAGVAALGYFRRDPRSWRKGATSVVSEADLALDRLLTERLRQARPDYGWLSEETEDNTDRLSRKRVFVVDPIDGTREFIAGGARWAISLAVVEDERPIAAVVSVPALGEIYRAALGRGAERDGGGITVSGRTSISGMSLAAPRRFKRLADAAGIPAEGIRYVPSLAYRFTLVASGSLDAAVSGPNANDWDLAAADLLVHEAGGRLMDLTGRPPRYNKAEPRHPPLVAATPLLADEVAALVADQRHQS